MARGWESKSVEAQQDEAQRQTRRPEPELTPEERERHARRQTLVLARARAVADLAKARTAAHREMLERSLAAIDQALDGPGRT